ncbi:hypothetical protein TWF718_007092 [Orbilia javanica]|uniref:Uncharacterized protein n=1 Tax=Orbilia javanica TaxID=47235 RepID=A0AAN8MT11_9PEZI
MDAEPVTQAFAEGINMILDRGISLIQWGDQVHLHWGYPATLAVYDFAIEDSRLEEAVDILKTANIGFIPVAPYLDTTVYGVLRKKGFFFIHRLDQKSFPTRLHLIPGSLVHLSIHHADLLPSPFGPAQGLYLPKLPDFCVSLIRCIEDYAADSPDTFLAERSLHVMLAAAIYKEPGVDGKIYVVEQDTESEEDFRARQKTALQEIEAWELAEDDEPYRPKMIQFLLSGSIP